MNEQNEQDVFSQNATVEPSKQLRATLALPTRRASLFGSRFAASPIHNRKSVADGALSLAAGFGEVLGFAVAITLPYSRTGPKPNGMRVLYVIVITMLPPPSAVEFTPPKSWEAVKRFGDFVQFDKELRELLLGNSEFELMNLPSRSLITSQFDDSIISQRRQHFLYYLQAVLNLAEEHEQIQPLLAKFLGVSSGMGLSSRSLLESPTAASALEQQGTAFKADSSQHGFVYKLTGQLNGLIKPTFRLVWMMLNTSEGDLKIYNPEQTTVLQEIKIGREYGKVLACEPKEFGIPATGAFGFTVWTPHAELVLYAESNEDRTMWTTTLQQMFSSRLPPSATAAPKPKARAPLLPRPSAVFSREAKDVPILLKPRLSPPVGNIDHVL
ncbi:hypothetical protein BASA81_001096 [Batrachochytrium salamandrivorans]|nr:hypothetical protein BASA81_001096 [Batrachochytrium salamandrivorans]